MAECMQASRRGRAHNMHVMLTSAVYSAPVLQRSNASWKTRGAVQSLRGVGGLRRSTSAGNAVLENALRQCSTRPFTAFAIRLHA